MLLSFGNFFLVVIVFLLLDVNGSLFLYVLWLFYWILKLERFIMFLVYRGNLFVFRFKLVVKLIGSFLRVLLFWFNEREEEWIGLEKDKRKGGLYLNMCYIIYGF